MVFQVFPKEGKGYFKPPRALPLTSYITCHACSRTSLGPRRFFLGATFLAYPFFKRATRKDGYIIGGFALTLTNWRYSTIVQCFRRVPDSLVERFIYNSKLEQIFCHIDRQPHLTNVILSAKQHTKKNGYIVMYMERGIQTL